MNIDILQANPKPADVPGLTWQYLQFKIVTQNQAALAGGIVVLADKIDELLKIAKGND